MTWGNQPQAAAGVPAASAPAPRTSSYVEWTVTQQVKNMLTGTNNGFLVRDRTENGGGLEQGFHSREKSDNPPRLVITFG